MRSLSPARFAITPVLALAALIAGPAAAQQDGTFVAPFSTAKPGTGFPRGWEPLKLGSKKVTEYSFVDDGGTVVLLARSDAAASGYLHPVKFDLKTAPVIQFRWKINKLIDGADNAVAAKEDSPARVILNFDGDTSKLTLREKTSSALARTATGRDLPYAQLIYIWSNTAPVGTVINNPHTARVRMMVAVSGPAQVGQWVEVSRNAVADFTRAFGEPPGKLLDVGVMTDTDNTGASVEARYGDLRFTAP